MIDAEKLGPKHVGKRIQIDFKSGDRVVGTLKSVQQDLANYQTDYSGTIESIFEDGFGLSTTVTVAIANHKLKVSIDSDRVDSIEILERDAILFHKSA